MAAPSLLPAAIVDPHFHMWTIDMPNPNLGDIVDSIPRYLPANYAADVAAAGLPVVGAVHVEAIVGQREGGAKLDEVAETAWVTKKLGELPPHIRSARVVPYANLARADIKEVLDAHAAAAGDRLAGIRQILNYDAADPTICWPQVDRGDYLTGGVPSFADGFAELVRRELSFDLQCNPPQLSEAALFLKAFPGVTVVVNHLGCPRLGRGADEDAAVLSAWRSGMAALAANPRVLVKVSMLGFIRKDWLTDADAAAQVAELVHEVLVLFGPDRVMFASNYPVDRHTTAPLRDIYAGFERLLTAGGRAAPSPAALAALFHDTAARAYGLKPEA